MSLASLLVVVGVGAVVYALLRAERRKLTAREIRVRELPLDPYASLPLALGDVVTRGREERWCAGGVLAREGSRVVAAIFVSPEVGGARAVAALGEPSPAVLWLEFVEGAAPTDAPPTLELGRTILRRVARRVVSLEPVGEDAPPLAPGGTLALYAGEGDEAALVVVTSEGTLALRGVRLRPHEYERLPGGR